MSKLDTNTTSLRTLCSGWRVAAAQAPTKMDADRLLLSADVIKQLGQERDSLKTALAGALEWIEMDRESVADCGSQMRTGADGELERIPGTMDENTAAYVEQIDGVIAQIRAALKGGAS